MPSTAYFHSPGTIGRLKLLTQFDVRSDAGSTEWFRLHSSALSGKQLFMMLEVIWPAIVGPEYKKFALIHCKHGQNAGVWFHLLPNDEYEPGCHEVETL